MSRSSSLPWRLIGPAIAAACAALAVQAEEFSWQLSGAARQSERGDFDSDSWVVDATYYVNPIDDSAGPLALASFLNPTTHVAATASGSDSSQAFIGDPTAYALSGAYVLPGEQWYFGANYAKSNVDDVPPVTRSDPKGYGLHAGRYLGAHTTLELRLGRSEEKQSLVCPPGVQVCIGFPVELKTTRKSAGLEVLHVRRFRSLTYSLQGSVSESDTDLEIRSPSTPLTFPSDSPSARVYSVATELFPTDRLGVRVGYSRPDGDFDVDAYDVATTWYLAPRVALQFELSRSTVDDVPPELRHSDGIGVRFIGRL